MSSLINDLFHPVIDVKTFCNVVHILFPSDTREILMRMKSALEYDDPSYLREAKYDTDTLTHIFKLMWNKIPYIQMCYTQKAFNLCIYYLELSYKNKQDITAFLIQFSLEFLSKLLVKCLHSDYEYIGDKILNDLFHTYGTHSYYLFYEMWEHNTELRYFTLHVNKYGILTIRPIDSNRHSLGIYETLHNPLYFLKSFGNTN